MFRATHCPSSGAQTVIAASDFTYVFGCQPLQWLSHRSGIINSTTQLHLGGSFYEICLSVCLSTWNNPVPSGQIFMKFGNLVYEYF
jgi:hypothetical protein